MHTHWTKYSKRVCLSRLEACLASRQIFSRACFEHVYIHLSDSIPQGPTNDPLGT